MKYSIIIPSYDPTGEKQEMFADLLSSIDSNSVGKDYEIIIRKNGPSFTESHNDALRSSRGDYLIILNDDVLIEDENWLEKLTSDDKILSTKTTKFHLDNSSFWAFDMWSMSRNVFEKMGYFDEAFKDGYNYEDNDYAFRAKELGIEVEIVDVDHKHFTGTTWDTYYVHDRAMIEVNKQVFLKKWKIKDESI